MATPKTISKAPAATTRKRNLRLVPTIQRIKVRRGCKRLGHHSSPLIPASAPTSSGAPTTTTGVPTGGPLLELDGLAGNRADHDGHPDVGSRRRRRERPGLAVRVVDHGGVRDDLSRTSCLARQRTNRLGTEAEPLLGALADRKTRGLAFFGGFLDSDCRLWVSFVRRPGLAAAAGTDTLSPQEP